jgi:mannose-6-phosphate isomerase-like protein (cupin superfamily)
VRGGYIDAGLAAGGTIIFNMPVTLDGGCLVSGLKEGQAWRRGALRIWKHAGREQGARAISLRVLELDGAASLRHETSDEVLYVVAGRGTATIEGEVYELEPDHGVYLPPGTELRLNGAMTLVSSQCPDPDGPLDGPALDDQSLDGYSPGARRPDAPLVVAMESRPVQRTSDRWYREIINDEAGSTQVTQFVGAIPPGRAPDHYHRYEEVLCILDGHGAMWAGTSSTPIERGSCIFLPRGQMHCVENRGDTELRLLGVFYPAGSPAVRYSS